MSLRYSCAIAIVLSYARPSSSLMGVPSIAVFFAMQSRNIAMASGPPAT